MFIVLEGVDGAGKTTLSQRLIGNDEGAIRLHSGPLKGDPLVEYLGRLRGYKPDSTMTWIADRWHVGELVYGPLFRQQCKLTPAMTRHAEMSLDKLGALKLVVTAPMPVVLRRLATRGEDLLRTPDVGLVWDFYNEYAAKEEWQTVDSDHAPYLLKAMARRKRAEARAIFNFTSYVGRPHPRNLILTAGSAERQPRRIDFGGLSHVPYPGTIGERILATINRSGVRSIGLADPKVENVGALWRALGRPNVVCVDPETERLARMVPHQTIASCNVHPSAPHRLKELLV